MKNGNFMRGLSLRHRLAGASALRRPAARYFYAAAVGAMALGAAAPAQAFNLYNSDGWEADLSTTIQYSGGVRVNKPSQQLLAHANLNDGDYNFQHGFVSNQFEVVPVLSVTNGNFGVHVSGEAYLDTSYLQRNENDSAGTLNYLVPDNRNFPRSTQNVDGRNAELLDAFAYDSINFGSSNQQSLTFKVGRQTLLWGQSLFYSNDGIAAGQAPVDINKALTLANPQAQQIFLPVGQAVLTYQPNDWLTLQGYYQFEWRPSQFPGAGSYFAPADFVVPGGTTLILAPTPFGPAYLARAGDLRPGSQNGQFGLSAQAQLGNFDLGVYGLRFDDKTPQVYLNIGGLNFNHYGVAVGTYQLAYAKDIEIYGASLSTTIGPVNVAGEISGRTNQDLYSNAEPLLAGNNENSNPGWAVGDVVNAQVSAIYLSPGLPLLPGGLSVAGEIVKNQVVAVTANRSALVTGRTPGGLGFTVTVNPNFYNVLPNLDLNLPVGFAWDPTGRSQFDPGLQAGTGSLNIGVTATYRAVWKAGVNYEDYLGSTSNVAPGKAKQGFADRGYVSLFLSRTF